MNTTALITITGAESAYVSAIPAALARRDELLATAKKGQRIASAESCVRASNLLKDLKGFEKAINDSHEIAKAPVLELGRKIDRLKKDLLNDITAEGLRIGRLVGEFNAAQERAAAEARRAAEAEAKRLRDEAEAQQRAADAEAARKVAEANAAAEKAAAEGNALAKAQADRAAAEAKAQAERDAAAAKANTEAQIAANQVALATSQLTKPTGVSTRADVGYEVTDIVALYAANPQLVTLTVKVADLKAALKALPEGATLPGVKHWATSSAVVRT